MHMSNTYAKLLAASPTLSSEPYREHTALKMKGTKDQIVSLYDLLCNYTHQKVGGTPYEPRAAMMCLAALSTCLRAPMQST